MTKCPYCKQSTEGCKYTIHRCQAYHLQCLIIILTKKVED